MFSRENLKLAIVAVFCLLLAWTGPSIAHGVHAKFAHNAGKVDGKHAVGAGASLTKARGKLVAHNRNGKLPARFLPGIGGSLLRDGAITSEKVADGAVTSEKVADGAVTREKVADGAVGGAQIRSSSVSSEKLGWIFQVSKVTGSISPQSSVLVSVTCPSGSEMLAGGFAAPLSWRITISRPVADGWQVRAENKGSHTGRATVYANCLP